MKPEITLISNNDDLESACAIWNSATILALDTEFIRTDTFYPIPALLQIYDGKKCYLVDLVAINDYSYLVNILKNESIVKVLHSCSEDLEVFDRLLQCLPAALFDTQIAAAFLGYGFSIGYSRLVKTIFDIESPKDESRSNWLQRPLTADQIEYASLDVIYLYHIYLNFQKQLLSSQKSSWIEQSHEEMITNFRNNQKPEHSFDRFKSAWRLTSEQQEILFRICLWREEEARRRNKPRSRILHDDLLFEHAQKQNLPSHYRPIETQTTCPEVDMPLPRETGDLLKNLKQEVEKKALELNIAPEILGKKKDLTSFINSGIKNGVFQLPKALSGWRMDIIGSSFLNIANHWQNTKS